MLNAAFNKDGVALHVKRLLRMDEITFHIKRCVAYGAFSPLY